MSRTVKRVAAGLTSAAAIVAAFGLAATPPPAEPASSGSAATLVIRLGPDETIEGISGATTGATTGTTAGTTAYAHGHPRWNCDKPPSVG